MFRACGMQVCLYLRENSTQHGSGDRSSPGWYGGTWSTFSATVSCISRATTLTSCAVSSPTLRTHKRHRVACVPPACLPVHFRTLGYQPAGLAPLGHPPSSIDNHGEQRTSGQQQRHRVKQDRKLHACDGRRCRLRRIDCWRVEKAGTQLVQRLTRTSKLDSAGSRVPISNVWSCRRLERSMATAPLAHRSP